MGLFDKLREQAIDIIEWPDMESSVLVHRFNRKDHEIKWHAKLIVRPGQRAVFVNEGKVADDFGPGTYTLDTKNLPILRNLLSWAHNFESPYKAEVYFINTTELLDRKWGTPNPIMLRDADFGIVRLRARGNYSYKIGIDKEMISRFVGAKSTFTVSDIEGQIRAKLLSSLTDALGEAKIPALDLAAKYDELGDLLTNKLGGVFSHLGLELLSFAIENITLPEEVEKAMDQRASMGALGNLNDFSQYQAAYAIRDAAKNQGGAGNMMGMMMGAQMAGGITNTLHQNQPQAQAGQSQTAAPAGGPPPIPQQTKYFVALNGQQAGPFSVSEIQQQVTTNQISRETLVWKDGMANWQPAGENVDLASLFAAAPPPLPPQ